MLLDGAFRDLLLLVVVMSGASAVVVPPPTNLRVSCKNLNVMASWEFSRQQPPTVFRVDLGCAATPFKINTTEHQFNLTSFIWSSEDSYMDNFCVTVTAQQGSRQSEPVTSKTFSFNTMKTTDIKCKLDFPPVDLKWTDSGATVSFRNPFHVYSLKADKPSAACFELNASTTSDVSSKTDISNKCTAEEEICKLDVPFLYGVEKCVSLTGWLFDSDGFGEISFRKVERICVDEPAEEHLMVLLVVLLSLTALVVVSIIVCVCATKAWTMKTPQPFPLWPDPPKQNPRDNDMSDPVMDLVTLTGNPQEGGFCSDSEGRFSASSSSSRREQEDTALMYAGNGMDDDSADSSVKTECVSLQSDEMEEEVEEEVELERNYDRPQNLRMNDVQVDMGDGEMVTAYLGR